MCTIESNQYSPGARLVTSRSYNTGQLIQTISQYQITDAPTEQSIQVGIDKHIEELGVITFLNHSCHPSVIVETTTLKLYAARPIATGEELTFFYPSTEWEMVRPFSCQCGTHDCIRTVAGAKYLTIDRLARYFINPHIREMVAQSLHSVVMGPEPRLPGYAPLLVTPA